MSDVKTPQQAVKDQLQTLQELDGQAKAILDKAQRQIDGEKGKGVKNDSAAADAIAMYSQRHSETNQYEYLVRGATLICRNGSHKRKINLPKCHGVYVGEHPVLHQLECVTELVCGKDKCNVTYFGVCTPEEGEPPESDEVVCIKTRKNSKDGTEGEVTGHRCEPKIIGTWMDTYPASRIVDNGDKNPADRFRAEKIAGAEIENVAQPYGESTITTGSFLVCLYGGIIEPITSGQGEPIREKDFKDNDKNNNYEKVKAWAADGAARVPVEKGGVGDPKGSAYDVEEGLRDNNKTPCTNISEFKARYGDLIKQYAQELGIDPNVLGAIFFTESSGGGFYGNDKLKIRFEEHIFLNSWAGTNGKYKEYFIHSSIDYSLEAFLLDGVWINTHSNQPITEYQAFEFAKSLDEKAAYNAISMGFGQQMGFNYATCGYESAKAMFSDYSKGELQQIDGTINFITNYDNGACLKALQSNDYDAFGLKYNGSSGYSQKIQTNIENYKNTK